MKYLKILSIIAILISLSAMVARFYSFSKTVSFNFPTYDKNTTKADSTAAITNYDMNQLKELVLDSASNIDYTHKARLKSKMAAGALENNILSEKTQTDNIFWAKVIFSGIFCLAALFVVLSKKYDDETKKWAFSVLTLIAGVWIGTATK